MARSPFATLRSRLVLLVLLAVVPALGLTLYTNVEQRQRTVVQVQGEALRLARLTSADQGRLVEGARQLLAVLARLPAVREGDPITCGAFFAELLQQYPRYANFGVARPNGDVTCTALPSAGGISIADRTYFQRALQTREFAVGEYQVGRITGRASVNFGFPVLDAADQVQAVVFASLDLAWLNQLAAEAQLPRGSALTLIDRNGTILVRYPDSEEWIGKPMAEVVVAAIRTRQGEGTTDGPGADGVPRLYAFAPLGSAPRSADAHVIVGIPVAVAFAEADRTLNASLRWMGLVGGLALVTAAVGGDLFILRRIHALIRATKRLSAGDLGARTGLPPSEGELGQLAGAIDEMAASLQRTHERLTNDLLDLTRLEAGQVQLHRTALDIVPLIRRVAAALRPTIDAKRHQLTLVLPDAPLRVWADPERLGQILTHLISNAHEYTPAGGRINVAASSADGSVRVDIQDTGIGLSPDEQAQVFTKFFRASPSAAEQASGAGLGLAISRLLVELHGGQITVASEAGQGSTFSLTLPRPPAAELPQPEESDHARGAGAGGSASSAAGDGETTGAGPRWRT